MGIEKVETKPDNTQKTQKVDKHNQQHTPPIVQRPVRTPLFSGYDKFIDDVFSFTDIDTSWTDEGDDGSISLLEMGTLALKSAGRFVKNTVKHPIMLGAGIALTWLGGPVVAGALTVLGLGFGLFQMGKGIYKYRKAGKDAEAKLAFSDACDGAITAGLSALAMKGTAKASAKFKKDNITDLKVMSKAYNNANSDTYTGTDYNLDSWVGAFRHNCLHFKNYKQSFADIKLNAAHKWWGLQVKCGEKLGGKTVDRLKALNDPGDNATPYKKQQYKYQKKLLENEQARNKPKTITDPLQEKKNAAAQEVQTKQKAVNNAQKAVDAKNQEIQNLEGQLKQLNKQKSDLQTKIDQANNDIAQARAGVSKSDDPGIAKEISRLEKEINNAKKDCNMLTDWQSDLRALKDTRNKISELSYKINQLNSTLKQINTNPIDTQIVTANKALGTASTQPITNAHVAKKNSPLTLNQTLENAQLELANAQAADTAAAKDLVDANNRITELRQACKIGKSDILKHVIFQSNINQIPLTSYKLRGNGYCSQEEQSGTQSDEDTSKNEEFTRPLK